MYSCPGASKAAPVGIIRAANESLDAEGAIESTPDVKIAGPTTVPCVSPVK
jgi:hypothetical protein